MSYVPSLKGARKPQFVFTFNTKHTEELLKRFHFFSSRGGYATRVYLGEERRFHTGELDLFGERPFGFGRCGTFSVSADDTVIRVEVESGARLHETALTIHTLLEACSWPFDEHEKGNKQQLFQIQTSCERAAPYGHAINGHVSSRVGAWLLGRALTAKDEHSFVPLPEEVIEAMRNAWKAATGKKELKFPGDFRGSSTHDGRFMLTCPGNACDVAIYPDMVYGKIRDYGAGLSCHNLDNAEQQIALLAGLATIAELVEREV